MNIRYPGPGSTITYSDMLLCEGFYRQPIALIGHDGLERGGGRSDPASLPNNY